MNMQEPPESTESEELSSRPNKSAQKREIAQRSALIERLAGLSESELLRLQVPEDLLPLLRELRSLKASGARNRHLKYCVKRFVDVDLQLAETFFADRNSQRLAANQALHRIEQWRERLLAEGDSLLGEALVQWPNLDRQYLRQLIRAAQREQQVGSPAGAGRQLFRYLRDLDPDI